MVDAYCHCCVFNKLTNICSQFLFFCDGLILAPLCTKPNWLLNCPQKAKKLELADFASVNKREL